MIDGAELSLKIDENYFKIIDQRGLLEQYPSLDPLNNKDKNIAFLLKLLMADKNIKFKSWHALREGKNRYLEESEFNRIFQKKAKKQNFFKENYVNYITLALKLWKCKSAMNIIAAYELRRFRNGFDYNFKSITQLMSYQWAEKKGYIKNESDTEKFKTLFTKSIHRVCKTYKIGSLIIDPRGIQIPISLGSTDKGIRYCYKKGKLTIQNDQNTTYIFQHHGDSIQLISKQENTPPIRLEPWYGSGNIGTSQYARMHGCEKTKFYGFKIWPASIGCYRDIILEYTQDESMFYGFAKFYEFPHIYPNSIYFFYGNLPLTTEKNISLNDIFSLNEIMYYRKYEGIIDSLYLTLLRFIPTSRINTITASNSYLNHIFDTFYNEMGMIGKLPKNYLKIPLFFLFLIELWDIKEKGFANFKEFGLIIGLSFTYYIFCGSVPYTNLYILCGLE